jgi:hypothetical protein
MYLLLILASPLPYKLVLNKVLNRYLARNDLCITGSPAEKKFSVGVIPPLLGHQGLTTLGLSALVHWGPSRRWKVAVTVVS